MSDVKMFEQNKSVPCLIQCLYFNSIRCALALNNYDLQLINSLN